MDAPKSLKNICDCVGRYDFTLARHGIYLARIPRATAKKSAIYMLSLTSGALLNRGDNFLDLRHFRDAQTVGSMAEPILVADDSILMLAANSRDSRS